MMTLKRNQKMLLFIFGCPDRLQTQDNLQFASMLATDSNVSMALFSLMEMLIETDPADEQFEQLYYDVRSDLELVLYASVIYCYADDIEHEPRLPMLNLLKSIFVAGFAGDSMEEALNGLELLRLCITDAKVWEAEKELTDDIYRIQHTERDVYENFIASHRSVAQALDWLCGDPDDETNEPF